MSASARAAAVTGQASYRVRQARANATPTLTARGDAPFRRSTYAMTIATATVIVARSSGSVIGVDWRYSTFGLSAKTAAPAAPASRDPVTAATIHAIAAAATPNATTDIVTADAPLR